MSNASLSSDTSRAARAAALLAEARRLGQPIAELPEDLIPTDIAGAYAVQDETVSGQAIGCWKVGRGRDGAEPRCAAIGEDDVHFVGDEPAHLDVSRIRPEIEVEVGVRLASDLPKRERAYTADDVLAAIGSVHLAVEVISSRFINRKAVSPLSGVADQQSCSGIYIGPAVTDWQGIEFGTVDLALAYDGAEVATRDGGASRAEVLEWLAWLANHAAGRTGGLKAGQVIVTGARIGPAPMAGARQAVANSRVLGRMELVAD